MPGSIQLVEQLTPYELLDPATDAAGRGGLYVKLNYGHRATIIFTVQQGSASTILLTPKQATDEEGASAKVLTNNCRIWSNLDTTATGTLTRRADAKNYTTDAGTKNKIVVFQIDAEELDVANGFMAIGLTTGASSASNLTQAIVLVEQRYAQPIPPEPTDTD